MTSNHYGDIEEPEIIDQFVTHHGAKGGWNVGKIFWGLLLVLIGSLVLANNFGLVELNWVNLWQLWPLFIISAGLSTISLHNVVWRIIKVVFMLLALIAIAWVLTGGSLNANTLKAYNLSVQKASVSIKQAEINIKAGVSTLTIKTADQNEVAKSSLESNFASVSETSIVSADSQRVNLTMNAGNNNWLNGNVKSIWIVNLTRNLPIWLNVDASASDANIDMSLARLKSAVIKAGASNIVLKLGNKELTVNINIGSGVSSILIKAPVGSGVQVNLENGLTNNKLSDLVKVNGNTYQSAGYKEASKKINITTKIGVSSFSIKRY